MAKLTVSKIHGEVLATSRDGIQRTLKLGDVVLEGETITTKQGSMVSFAEDSGAVLNLAEKQYMVLSLEVFSSSPPTTHDSAIHADTASTVVQALIRGEDLSTTLDATAAGANAAGENGGSSFVQLLRIVENVDPLQYAYSFQAKDTSFIEHGAVLVPLAEQTAPVEPPVVPPAPPVPPVEPPDTGGDKDHKDNGGGNGVDPAPGGSGNTPGDNADGSNTPGTTDTTTPGNGNHTGNTDHTTDPVGPHVVTPPNPPEVVDPPTEDTSHPNNGFGNGDQTAPGNSGPNNNAENSAHVDPTPPVADPIPPLLPPEEPPVDNTPGNSGQNNGWGNGDQTAPGNSGPNNNAENSDAANPLLKDNGKPDVVPAESNLHANDLLDSSPIVGDNTQVPNYLGLLLDLQTKPNHHE